MNLRPPQEDHLPTLTQVVEGEDLPVASQPPSTEPVITEGALEADITMAVLQRLEKRLDLMLEYRLREALAPALARATQLVMAESQTQLATTLREMVQEAVAQEVLRARSKL